MTDNRQDDLGIHQANLLDETTIREFSSEVQGRLIRPHDDGYDEARTVFYGGFDRRPGLIVRVEDASDVSHARAGWSSPSAAAATASPVTASPMGESCSTSRR
jgi:hypothetical protein